MRHYLRLLEETYRQQTGRTADYSSFGKALARMDPAFFEAVFARLYSQLSPHSQLSPQAKTSELRAVRLRFVDAAMVTPFRILIYTSLTAALLLIWYKRETGIDRGWRSVKFWLAQSVRIWTEQVLRSACFVPSVPDG